MRNPKVTEYIRRDMKGYRLMSYTEEYSDAAKKTAGRQPVLLTAEEHSKMSETDFARYYKSRDELMKWYYQYISNIDKLELLPIVVKEVYNSHIERIVSFGAGPGVLEYFLSLILGKSVYILAADYDQFLVHNGTKIFTEENKYLEFKVFDFYKDSVQELVHKYQPQMAVFFGSACSMDNKTYLAFLKQLRKAGIRKIITFEAGVLEPGKMFLSGIRLFAHAAVRYILRYPNRDIYACHAWKRSYFELKDIYRKSGYRERRLKNSIYQYAYVLEI